MVREESQLALRRRPSRSPSPLKTGISTAGKATRTVEILNEDGTESITIAAASTTKTTEVVDIISSFTRVDGDKIRLVSQVGTYSRQQSIFDEVASKVTAVGVKSFSRRVAQYDHPAVIIGAGLGGIQTMVHLKKRGRNDFVCLEKLDDFGGHSWMVVANKFTKLQTEKGTYHVDYPDPDKEVPEFFGDMEYKTWPTRDQLLRMFRQNAREHGLYDYTRFNVCVEKVRPLPGKFKYGVTTVSLERPDEGSELLLASSVLAWPGNLCDCREIVFPGEDLFEGYIEYSSFSRMDYTRTAGKEVILYGHGAFTIENVRTLLEHRCKKVTVMCRKRNLCGMKVVSWLCGYSEVPVPGTIVLEGFQKMYDLLDVDVWSAHCVTTDKARTYAHLSQKTIFGVTDIYFLAGYYGLMEVVVDEIKRLDRHCAHTKKGDKIPCEVILKAVGTVPSFQIDRMLGLKELHGLWVNGDPARPVVCNAMYVEARNFGSFSSGPGFATMVVAIVWFLDYPEDWEVVKGFLPINKAGERPAYVPAATHMTPTMSTLGAMLPMLGMAMNATDAQKSIKQQKTHPIGKYIAECRAEWEGYIKAFKRMGMIDASAEEKPYPYTEEMVKDWLDRSQMYWVQRAAKQG